MKIRTIKQMESENYPYGGKVDVCVDGKKVFFNTTNSNPIGQEVVARFDGWKKWRDDEGNSLTRQEVAELLEDFNGYTM